jgi:uncharacterized protein (TIGR02722 family)
MKQLVIGLLLVATVVSGAGCAAFRMSVREEDPETSGPLTAKYDQRDLLTLAAEISQDVLGHPFPPQDEKTPIMVTLGIQNRTKSHHDMKALSDTIETKLMDSRRLNFINAARRDDLLKEQGYQLANVTPETRAAVGKQLGAKYMLTGSLIEIEKQSGRQVRVSKKQDVYYQLTLEITDLQTGLIVVRKQRDRLRRASKPLIGW